MTMQRTDTLQPWRGPRRDALGLRRGDELARRSQLLTVNERCLLAIIEPGQRGPITMAEANAAIRAPLELPHGNADQPASRPSGAGPPLDAPAGGDPESGA